MDSPPTNIGHLLRTRREQLGYSLQSVAEQTRIRKVYLDSLENNNFAELPGRAYVTGFIRVYARHLGLNSNDVLALLDEAPASEMKTARLAEPGSKVLAAGPSAKNPGGRAFFYGFALVLLFGAGVYFLPSLLTDDVPDPVVSAPAPGADVAPVKTEPVLPMPSVSSRPADEVATPPVAGEETVAVGTLPTATGHILPSIPTSGGTLRMLALEESSLIITFDDKKPHRYPLHAGLDLVWAIKQQVSVEMKNADVARFWFDGQELDVAGQTEFQLLPAE